MPKHIKIQSEEISYPVGLHMNNLLSATREMAELISSEFPVTDKLQFAVRGSSGAIIAGLVVANLVEYDVQIIHVKKQGENSHSNTEGNLYDSSRKLIILDDFICSGITVNKINEAVKRENPERVIDLLCVTGNVRITSLEFNPLTIICENLKV